MGVGLYVMWSTGVCHWSTGVYVMWTTGACHVEYRGVSCGPQGCVMWTTGACHVEHRVLELYSDYYTLATQVVSDIFSWPQC